MSFGCERQASSRPDPTKLALYLIINPHSRTPCDCSPKAEIEDLAKRKGLAFEEIEAAQLSTGIGYSEELDIATPQAWVVVLKIGDATAYVGTDGLDLQTALNQIR